MGRSLGGRYRIDELIGHGSTGEVHAGTDTAGGRVAVELLRRDLAADPDIATRFVRERTILLGVRDPHVVAVRDTVVEGDTLAIVMDLVPGQDLRRALCAALARGAAVPPAEVARQGAGLGRGLAAVHSAGVVHGDVKPENVLLDASATPPAVRLADPGISRLLTTAPARATRLVGTPPYMAPELWGGTTPTPAANLHGLDVLLYELLCGLPPFVGAPMQVMRGHLDVGPESSVCGTSCGQWSRRCSPSVRRPVPPARFAAALALEALAPRPAGVPGAPPATTPPSGRHLTPRESGRSRPTRDAGDLEPAAGPAPTAVPPASGPPRPLPAAGAASPAAGPVRSRARRGGPAVASAATAVVLAAGVAWGLPALVGGADDPAAASASAASGPSAPGTPEPAQPSPGASAGGLLEELGAGVSGLLGAPSPTAVPGGPECVAFDRPPTNATLLTTSLGDRCRADVGMVHRRPVRGAYLTESQKDRAYGSVTHAAVGRFQRDRCLDVEHYDISVVPKSWQALEADSSSCGTATARPGTSAAPTPAPTPTP